MDNVRLYLVCFGIPLVPLLLGIVALFLTRKDSPRQYAYSLAAINIYALTMVPLYIITSQQFYLTVIGVATAVLVAVLLNIVAERKQPESEKKWELATPLLFPWLFWSAAVLIINYSYFAGEYNEWAGLMFVGVVIFCTPIFFIISLASVAYFLNRSNPAHRTSGYLRHEVFEE